MASSCSLAIQTPIRSGTELADYLLEEAQVAVIPGEAFGAERYLRLSFAASLARLTHSERAVLPALEPGRADLIVPGTVICLASMARVGFDALTVSDRGLREGILCEILGAVR